MRLGVQHDSTTDDDTTPATNSNSVLGAATIVAALFMATVFPAADLMTGHEPTDLQMHVSDQENAWRYEDVDPAFALDGRPFFIEPAAGPPDPAELQTCFSPISQEEGCDQRIVVE